ncbi:MAG: flavoprotein [Candidatus Omnitrophota bacterium]
MGSKNKSVIVGVTGSIAAYKACGLVNAYRKKGFDVTCALTKEALHFVTPLTLETLSGNKIVSDMFTVPGQRSPMHVSLADRADLIVIYPASANIIGKLAQGICDDIITCTILASKAPVVIAPAMNNNMYNHKSVQKNIQALKDMGYTFVGPVEGDLACGCYAVGHIADAADVMDASLSLLK